MSIDLEAINRRYEAALDARPAKGEWTSVQAAILADSVADVKPLMREVETLRGQVEAVRAATANHPDPCEKHPDGDTVTCGWKSAYRDVVRALEAA